MDTDGESRLEQMREEMTTLRARLAELERENDLFHALLDELPFPIYFKDTASRFLCVSRSQACRFNLPPEEVVGKTDFDFFTEEHARPAYEDEMEVMRTGQPVVREEKETWPDGRVTWVSTIKLPLRDRDTGEIIGTFGASMDITERKQAEQSLEDAYANLEKLVAERTAELEREIAERERVEAERLQLQQEVIEAQKQALRELSTPIIPIMERIIVLPLIGSIDSARAREITRRLMAGIHEHRAQVVIIDVTGVSVVDSGVAAHLNKTIQAARLKGARTIVTGLADAVAETIVELGIDWSGVETLSDLQSGLLAALDRLGVQLVRRRRPAEMGGR